jgi:hypothetical protein
MEIEMKKWMDDGGGGGWWLKWEKVLKKKAVLKITLQEPYRSFLYISYSLGRWV